MKYFFNALTGLRIIAAWMVFIYHFFPYKNPSIPKIFKDFFGGFEIGVDMFFVLSGFLITYRYYEQEIINYKNYFINRFSRIYPMFFLVTVISFLYSFLFRNEIFNLTAIFDIILNLTLTKTIFHYFVFNGSGIVQGWTLTLEALFYLFAPIFFILIKKSKFYILFIPFLILLMGSSLHLFFLNKNNVGGFMHNNFSVYIIEFFAGIYIALLIKNKNINKNYRLTYIGFFFILLFLLFKNQIFQFVTSIPIIKHILEITCLTFLGIIPFYTGLINEKTKIRKILNNKILVLLGKSSYVFYLIHLGPFYNFFYYNISQNKILIFIFLNVLSIVIFYYLEEPINNYIRRKFTSKSV